MSPAVLNKAAVHEEAVQLSGYASNLMAHLAKNSLQQDWVKALNCLVEEPDYAFARWVSLMKRALCNSEVESIITRVWDCTKFSLIRGHIYNPYHGTWVLVTRVQRYFPSVALAEAENRIRQWNEANRGNPHRKCPFDLPYGVREDVDNERAGRTEQWKEDRYHSLSSLFSRAGIEIHWYG